LTTVSDDGIVVVRLQVARLPPNPKEGGCLVMT